MKTYSWVIALVLAVLALPISANAAEPERLSSQQFARLHALIKPGAGESRWMEIDWHPSVWKARQKAAEQGKPIFIMAGSGGAPAAGC